MPSPALAYFLTRPRDSAPLDLLEFSHPSFTRVYRIVRNHRDGVTVTLETSAEASFDYYPVNLEEMGDTADLDNGIRVVFGDLGEILPKEIDEIAAAGTFDIKPTLIYRMYRSDDLTAPTVGPLTLEIKAIAFAREGATFEAAAPYVNNVSTGETYGITRFSMLRSVVK